MKVIILTNNQQYFGALISKYSFIQNSSLNERNIEILNINESYPSLAECDGETYYRNGVLKNFDINDLQSFTISRFFVPEHCNYKGKILAVDPDIFCVNNYLNYLSNIFSDHNSNFQILAKKGKNLNEWESSAMVMNCDLLKDFNSKDIISRLFKKKNLDYNDLMKLKMPELKILQLDEAMNSFDKLNSQTLLLHNTNRITQPWKEGLPINFIYHNQNIKSHIKFSIKKILKLNKFKRHPDKNQIYFFLYLVCCALKENFIDTATIENEIQKKNVRQDLLKLILKFDYIKNSSWQFEEVKK